MIFSNSDANPPHWNINFVLARKMVQSQSEMGNILNGNGNSHGTRDLVRQLPKRAARAQVAASARAVKQTRVVFRTHEAIELQGTLVRTTRYNVIFELYNPIATPRISEVLDKFQLIFQERVTYSGRAVIRNLVDAGTKLVCEATLNELDWSGSEPGALAKNGGEITEEFKAFLGEWQKFYKLTPEFKVVVADMQTFFHDLKCWLDQVELSIRSMPPPLQVEIEKKTLENLTCPVVQAIDNLIDRFDSIVVELEDEIHPAYQAHLRRQLHPYLLSSPFAHRAFYKPLGYAGDYQMVEMMIRSPLEGSNLFAKIINIWLLSQTPAQAHRNRVALLERRLIEEVNRANSAGRVAQVYNLGCGPAAEVRRFFKNYHNSNAVNFTLVDFNQETLDFLRQSLDSTGWAVNLPATCRLVKKSVSQVIRESGRAGRKMKIGWYDYIYCAGLFDYLPDNVCKQLMNIFFESLAPGGLLLATNVTDVMNVSRPFRYSMEYILDWQLIYRDAAKFLNVAPDYADRPEVGIFGESTGANLFMEVRKPKND